VHDERVLLALDALTGVAGVVRIAVGAFDAGAVT